MPIIKSAKKQLRQSKVHHARNTKKREVYKEAVKTAQVKPSKKGVALAYSSIDKAVKAHIIHKNKAARLKKQVARNVKN